MVQRSVDGSSRDDVKWMRCMHLVVVFVPLLVQKKNGRNIISFLVSWEELGLGWCIAWDEEGK